MASMILRIVLFLIVVGTVSAGLAMSTSDALGAPKGSVKLPAGAIKKVSGVTCGKVGGSWLGGTVSAKVYFLSFLKQAALTKAAAAKQSGSAKKKSLAQAAALGKRASATNAVCRPKKSAGSSSSTSTSPTAGDSTPVAFSFRDAVALGIVSQARRGFRRPRAGSDATLLAVDATGNTWDPVTVGSAPVTQVYVNSAKAYVSVSRPVRVGSQVSCRFLVATIASGDPACVSTSEPLRMSSSWSYSPSPSVQFDADGAAYFWLYTSGRWSLYRYSSGTETLVWRSPANGVVADFKVAADGAVVIAAGTTTGSYFTLRIAGGVETQLANQTANFIGTFPDGNIYFGAVNNLPGVFRYLVGAGAMDADRWIGAGTNVTNSIGGSLCNGGGGPINVRFCANPLGPATTGGSVIRDLFTTSGASTYAVTTANPPGISTPSNGDVLMRYYPTVEEVTTVIESYSYGVAAGSRVVVAGTDGSGRSALSVINGVEETLVVPLNTLSVSSLAYAPTSAIVTVMGTRRSDGASVIVRFSPSNPAGVEIVPTSEIASSIAAIR